MWFRVNLDLNVQCPQIQNEVFVCILQNLIFQGIMYAEEHPFALIAVRDLHLNLIVQF